MEAGDDAGKWYPVTACSQCAHREATAITAMQRVSGAMAWAGLMRCGSVWLCGECAQKIESVRGDEIKRLIETARARGLVVVMLTHTFPHRIAHTCRESMDGLAEALRKMRQRGGYQRFRKSLGFVGLVRSTEVTHGRNGWHPHVHEIWILDPLEAAIAIDQLDSKALEQLIADKVFPQWEAAAVSVFGEDRAPSREHGIDVSHVWSANDYLAKCPARVEELAAAGKSRWAADAEMTKTTAKRGRKGSRTFWEILESAADGNERDLALVRDYARGTWRKRRMYWTPSRTKKDGTVVEGLRDRFDIGEELTDEQIAQGELPMTKEQMIEEREKADPIEATVDLDLFSLEAIGRDYVDALQERLAPKPPEKKGDPLRKVAMLDLLRRDGWTIEQLADHAAGYKRYAAVHHLARRSGIRRDLKVEKHDPAG